MSSVREYGARGDGKTDDTAALRHAIEKGDGPLVFPPGDYRISRPLVVPLERQGRLSVTGQGGTARILMAGAGPALHLVGTHQKSALPASVADKVWQKERMPTVEALEIVGGHPEADGIRIEGAMQPTILNVLIRRVRHAIHLTRRNRNVAIAGCHLYDNSGTGVFFDHINLHQTNITGNHISYCKQGGIRIVGSEIRNLQVCGNDIEYNHDVKAEGSADILYDGREGTIREGTIVGNTIQALLSPGGANVRLIGVGRSNRNAVGMLTITGNLIGDQETGLHLIACRGVVISGNCFYSGHRHAVLAEDCEHLVLSGNSIDHNSDYKGNSTDRIVIRGCRNVTASAVVQQHTRPADGDDPASWEVRDSENVTLSACQILGARVRGVTVHNSSLVRITGCTIRGPAERAGYRVAVSVDGATKHVQVVNNFLGKGSDGDLDLPRGTGEATGNTVV